MPCRVWWDIARVKLYVPSQTQFSYVSHAMAFRIMYGSQVFFVVLTVIEPSIRFSSPKSSCLSGCRYWSKTVRQQWQTMADMSLRQGTLKAMPSHRAKPAWLLVTCRGTIPSDMELLDSLWLCISLQWARGTSGIVPGTAGTVSQRSSLPWAHRTTAHHLW